MASKRKSKKRRSAKQRANDRRLGMMARKRSRKASSKSRKRKVSKPRRRKTSTSKRKSSSRRKKSMVGTKIPFVNNPTVKKAATGIGLASIGATALGLVAPQLANNPIIRPALAVVGGGVPALIATVLLQGGLGNLGGGGNGGGAGAA